MDDTKSIKRSFSPYAPIAVGIFVVGAVVIVGFLVREAFKKSVDDREKQLAKQAGGNQKGGDPEAKRIDPAVLEEQRVLAQVRMQGIRAVHREISESLDKL